MTVNSGGCMYRRDLGKLIGVISGMASISGVDRTAQYILERGEKPVPAGNRVRLLINPDIELVEDVQRFDLANDDVYLHEKMYSTGMNGTYNTSADKAHDPNWLEISFRALVDQAMIAKISQYIEERRYRWMHTILPGDGAISFKGCLSKITPVTDPGCPGAANIVISKVQQSSFVWSVWECASRLLPRTEFV